MISSGSQLNLIRPPCAVQGKALSMTDQFTLPNTQYMISTMASIGFYSKPLLNACSKKIIGNWCYYYKPHPHIYIVQSHTFLTLQFSHLICLLENLHGIPFNRLLTVLLSCRELHYRDFGMLTGISDYIGSVIDIWTNKQVTLAFLVLCNTKKYMIQDSAG